MTTRDRYNVLLKVLGIWMVVAGLAVLPYLCLELHSYKDPEGFFYMLMGSVASPLIMVLAGYWLLFSTDWFVRTTFRSIATTDDETIPAVEVAAPSEALLSLLLKLIGIWNLVYGASGVPGIITYTNRHSFSDSLIYLITSAVPAILIVCGFFLVFCTGWFVRMARCDHARIAEPTQQDIRAELSSKQFFFVILKAVGVWIVIDGLRNASRALSLFRSGWENGSLVWTLTETVATPSILIGCGAWLFFGTNWFTKLAFSQRASSEDEDTDESGSP